MPEISGYIGSTQGVKATPMPMSSAQSAENGSVAVGASPLTLVCSPVTGEG